MLSALMPMEERIVLDAAPVAEPAEPAPAETAPAENASDAHASADDGNTDTGNENSNDGNESADVPAALSGDLAPAGAAPGSLVLVNSGVDGGQTLVDAAADDVATLIYDNGSTLEEIIAAIDARFAGEKFSNIALATHGAAGTVDLADNISVTAETLATDAGQQAFFNALGQMLTADGHLDVLSCFSAAGESGDALVNALREATGHEVAASTDATGNGPAADWVLETAGRDVAVLYFTATDDITARLDNPSLVVTNRVGDTLNVAITVNTDDGSTSSDPSHMNLYEAWNRAEYYLDAEGGEFDGINHVNVTIQFDLGLSRTIDCNNALVMSSFQNTLTIDGGVAGVTISAGDSHQIMSFTATATPLATANLNLTHLTFGHGSASNGGALSLVGNADVAFTVSITGCAFTGNQAKIDPAAGNGGNGGAVYAENLTSLDIRGSRFTDNKAEAGGGAVYAEMSNVSIADSRIERNVAGNTPGRSGSAPANGGGIYWKGADNYLTLTRTAINDNTVRANGENYFSFAGDKSGNINVPDGNGGGLYFEGVTEVSKAGIPDLPATPQLSITDCDVHANHADNYGGGIAVFNHHINAQPGTVPVITVTGGHIHGNQAQSGWHGKQVFVDDFSGTFREVKINAMYSEVVHQGAGHLEFIYRHPDWPPFHPAADASASPAATPAAGKSGGGNAVLADMVSDTLAALLAPAASSAAVGGGEVFFAAADGGNADNADNAAPQTAAKTRGHSPLDGGAHGFDGAGGEALNQVIGSLGDSLGVFGGMLSQMGSDGELAALAENACAQSVTLGVLDLNARAVLNLCDALLAHLADAGAGAAGFTFGRWEFNARAVDFHDTPSFSSRFAAAGADVDGGGEISAVVRECRQALVEAQGAALRANEILQLIAANVTDFSDRIVMNSFNAGLLRMVAANENLALRYEVLNGLIKQVEMAEATGRHLGEAELRTLVAGLTQDAAGKAKLVVGTSDRASTDTLASLTRQMAAAQGDTQAALREQITELLSAWQERAGVSAPAPEPAQPVTLAMAN